MEQISPHFGMIISLAIAGVHLLGILSAIDALNLVRSSQGAVAWGLSLITFPWGALPLYWTFGRRRFIGYRELHKRFLENHRIELKRHLELYRNYYAPTVPIDVGVERTLERISQSEFTGQNKVELLIDGAQTFDAIKASLVNATKFIYFQFYIIHDDEIGRELKEILINRAQAGIKVLFLYDEIGSSSLSSIYIKELTNAGVEVRPFATRQGLGNFFQFNFRNHRKIVVVDGQTAFVGGHNVGDEYLGRSKNFGNWRDTHLKIQGPAVVSIQSTFLLDWSWAIQSSPQLEWIEPKAAGNERVLPIAFGPADDESRGLLLFLESIRSAQKRLWIASPYFIPDDAILSALKLATLRGVDVRILLPSRPDQLLVWLASFYYIPDLVHAGVKIMRYQAGFMHQKVMLIDDSLGAVGTANLDNRSLKLNFEITIFVADHHFNEALAHMFERDFANSQNETSTNFESLPIWRRLGANFARLFSPIL